MRNLRGRLTLGITTVLALVLLAGGLLTVEEVDRSQRSTIDDRLRRTAELSRATAQSVFEQGIPDDDNRLDNVLRATRSSLRLSLGKTEILTAGDRAVDASDAPSGFSTRKVRGVDYRVYTEIVRDTGLPGRVRLELTTSLAQQEARESTLRKRLLALGLLMLLATAGGGWLTADLLLRPLRRLRRATAEIETDEDLSARVPVEGASELRSLAGSFNAMLVRLGRSAEERQRALEATRRFAADAGHELRTPLTSVQATLSVIARHPEMDPGQRKELAEDALDQQRRLVELLDGLQALARGDANVERVPLDLCDLVDRCVGDAIDRSPSTTFRSELPGSEVIVSGWEPGLRSLIDNLLVNAVRHGREDGTVLVTLSAGPQPVLEVHDDGPGIAEAERERIFERFARGEGERPAEGAGLGLAIVRAIAEAHGGRVALESAPGRGARFSIILPIATEESTP